MGKQEKSDSEKIKILEHKIKELEKRNAFYEKIFPIKIKNGTEDVLAIFDDITDKHNTGLESNKSEERFQSMFNQNKTVNLIIEPTTGKIEDCNKAATKFYGYSETELKNKTINEINILSENEIKNEMTKAVRLKNNYFNFKHRVATGEIKDVAVYSSPIKLKNEEKLFSIILDISKEKKAESELKKSLTKYKLLFNSIPLGVTVSDKQGNIVESNKIAEKILDLSIEEHKKRTISGKEWKIIQTDGTPMPAGEFASVRALKENKLVENIEMGIVKEDDKVTWISVSAIPLPLEDLGVLIVYDDITDKKIAENKTKASEEKYRNLFENLIDEVHLWKLIKDKNDKIITWELVDANPSALKSWGKTKKQVVGKTADEIFKSDATKQFLPIVKKVFTNGRSYKWEEFFPPTNQYLSMHTIPMGEYFISTGRDITDRRKAEEGLLENQYYLTKAQEIGKLGTWELDLIKNELIWTDQNYKNFGLATDTPLTYEIFLDCIHPEDRKYVNEEWIKAVNGHPYDIEHRILVNGQEKWLREKADITFDNKGKAIKAIGFTQDISERKKAEEQLIKEIERVEKSEKRLVEAQKLSKIGSWEYFMDTDTVNWSKELFNIFERPYDLPSPKFSLQRPFYTEESFAILDKAVQDCVQREISYEEELDIITSNGSVKQIISKGEVLKDENNKIIGCYGTAQDITQKKKIEKELIKAKEKAEESDRLKSAFLANMSHEIRTPMNGILGFANLLNQANLTGKQQKKYIGIIEKSGERMLNIINDIIDISKLESGTMHVNMKEANINQLLNYILTFFKPEAENKGLDLILKNTLPAKEISVITDSDKVSATLINLIKNAIKYTDKGSIEFGCDFIEIQNSTFLQFSVKDTGIGIAIEQQEVIFERFIQADIEKIHAHQGAGLGLSISKAYIEMLGGKLWLESKKGKGSSFYFTIPFRPLNDKESGVEKALKIKDDSHIMDLKILVAEDDETSAELITTIIEDYSKEIIIAKTGKEAIETCRINPDIDLILMDIQMPEINGYKATQQIRQFNREVVIIAQTAYGLFGDKEKALDAGCNDYIAKPIKKEILLELIQKYFK